MARKTSKQNVDEFYGKYGEIARLTLEAFNDVDSFELRPGEETPLDEYLFYAGRFVRKWKQIPQKRKSLARMTTLIFESFPSTIHTGEGNIYDSEGRWVKTVLSTPRVAIDDVREISQCLWKKIQRQHLHVVE